MYALLRHLRHILFLASSLLIVVPGLAADTSQEFRIATEGYRYAFPSDHGAHDEFRTEWWYYTGQLATKDGRPFGYQLTFFRRGMPRDQTKTLPSQWAVTQLYLAHFAVSDLSKGRFHFSEKISRAGLGKAGAARDRLHVWIDRWSAESPSAAPGTQTLQAADGDIAIQLTVSPRKPLVVHGTGGISHKGSARGQASHYYSFTRLATTGTLSIGAEQFDVTGNSWMDHEFGSADLGKDLVGWDWFSLQLDDQRELMLYRLRRTDGSADPASSGTVIDRDGRGHHLSIGDFTLEPTSYWTSQTSHARYPQRWRLTIPSQQLSLELVPLMAEQELSTAHSTQVTYWEGAIEATGSIQGRPARGQGYMELTGYAERVPNKL
ncbi:MAG: lipocalin-like domain-containing protein [Nitrospirota bacterium]|nr:lipocalin-like domain-containing protein [Nitrospirota bacterium]